MKTCGGLDVYLHPSRSLLSLLFNEAFNVRNIWRRMVPWLMNDELSGFDRGLIEVLSYDLPGGTEDNHENLSQDCPCPCRDSNRAPTEYKCRALPLDHPVQSQRVLTWALEAGATSCYGPSPPGTTPGTRCIGLQRRSGHREEETNFVPAGNGLK
jgi:hypothetical protein